MNEGRGDTETPRVADATSRYSRRIRGVRRELAWGSSPRRAVPSGARRDEATRLERGAPG